MNTKIAIRLLATVFCWQLFLRPCAAAGKSGADRVCHRAAPGAPISASRHYGKV